MTSKFIPYKPMKNKFCMTIIAKLWPMKFVMESSSLPHTKVPKKFQLVTKLMKSIFGYNANEYHQH